MFFDKIANKFFKIIKYIIFIFIFVIFIGFIIYILYSLNIFIPSGYKTVLVIKINQPIESQYLDINGIVNTLDNFHYSGLILYIDSPGGDTEAIRIVNALRGLKVPILCYIQGEGTSAAYWICSQSDYIIANPDSIVGNIGAYMQIIDIQPLLQKLGINIYYIQSTPYKTIGSPYENLTPSEREYLQGVVDNLTYQFEQDVLSKRNITNQTLAFSGLFFLPQTAKKLGLINEVGNFSDAKQEMAKMLNTSTNNIIFIYKNYDIQSQNPLLTFLNSYINQNSISDSNIFRYILLYEIMNNYILLGQYAIKIYL